MVQNNSVGHRSPAKEVRPSTYSSDKPSPRIARANSLFVELLLESWSFSLARNNFRNIFSVEKHYNAFLSANLVINRLKWYRKSYKLKTFLCSLTEFVEVYWGLRNPCNCFDKQIFYLFATNIKIKYYGNRSYYS